ncbi:MAG TPA: hypothetical protein VIU93_12215 [Gallionellaceae bacterium]
MMKLVHKAGGMVGTAAGLGLPATEVGALGTGVAGEGPPYICTFETTGIRSLLYDAAAPSVQFALGACVRLALSVLLAVIV